MGKMDLLLFTTLFFLGFAFYIQGDATKCPAGKFGLGCLFDCHCHEICTETMDSLGCEPGTQCSQGWTGHPACNITCSQGFYGINCKESCNCVPNNSCDPSNGLCMPGNSCPIEYYGSACKRRKPSITVSPIVTPNCNHFIVNLNTTAIDPSIIRLKLSVSVNNTDFETKKDSSIEPIVPQTKFPYYINQSINNYTQYSFKIVPYFSYLGYDKEGIPSSASQPSTLTCPPLKVNQSISGSLVKFSWKLDGPSNFTRVVVNITSISINYIPISEQPILLNVNYDQKELTQKLRPWTYYTASVHGIYANQQRSESFVLNFSTEPDIPYGPPINPRIFRNGTNAVVLWDPPLLQDQNGPFSSYSVQIKPNDLNVDYQISNMNSSKVSLYNMDLLVSYTINISFNNQIGSGPPLLVKLPILGPTNFKALGYSTNWILFSWQPPSNSIQKFYELQILTVDSTILNFNSSNNYYKFNLTKYPLKSFDTLQAELNVIYMDGTRASADSSIPLSLPQTKVYLVTANDQTSTNHVTLIWDKLPYPVDLTFAVSFVAVESLLPAPRSSNIIYDTLQTIELKSFNINNQVTLENLSPATRYEAFFIGPEVGSIIHSSNVNFWTKPEPFKANSIEPFLSYTFTGDSLILEFPNIIDYDGGPITNYFLLLSNVTISTKLFQAKLCNDHGFDPVVYKQVYFSSSVPRTAITLGFDKGILQNQIYTIHAVVQSCSGPFFETSQPRSMEFIIKNDSKYVAVLGSLLAISIIILVILILIVYCYCRRAKKSESFKPKTFFPQFGALFGKDNIVANLTVMNESACYQASSIGSSFNNTVYLNLPYSFANWSRGNPSAPFEPRHLNIDPKQHGELLNVDEKTIREYAFSFKNEFDSLPEGTTYSVTIANRDRNRSKNRDPNNVPYDHSRVVLGTVLKPLASSSSPLKIWDRLNSPLSESTFLKDSNGCETLNFIPHSKGGYINANYVDSYFRKKAYIVAQSPFDLNSSKEFWNMIYLSNVVQIVTLIATSEISTPCKDEVSRCILYWPELSLSATPDDLEINGTKVFGNLRIILIETVRYAYFSIRVFKLCHLQFGNSRIVTQYHFTNWTDIFVHPFSADKKQRSLLPRVQANLVFLEFYYRVKIASKLEDGPILVHCGSVTSRSALFCAFDRLYQQLAHERQVSVAKVCNALRRQRPNMIPSKHHYHLLYDILYEAALAGPSIIGTSDLRECLTLLRQVNHHTGRSYLWEQWSILHNHCPFPNEIHDLKSSLLPKNLHKNRFPRILESLPPDFARIHLPGPLDSSFMRQSPSHVGSNPDHDTYINAITVDSTRLKNDFILTQTPLQSALVDFWRLIQSESVSCVVDLEPAGYGHDGCVQYWPIDTNMKYRVWDWRSEIIKYLGTNNSNMQNLITTVNSNVVANESWMDIGFGISLRQRSINVSPTLNKILYSGVSGEASGQCWIKRVLEIKHHSSRRRHLTQSASQGTIRILNIFHYLGAWTNNFEVPESTSQLVSFVELIRMERGLGPLLLHCRDGATRCGVFLTCYHLADCLTADGFINPFHSVKQIKIRRRNILSNPEQWKFLYRFLIAWADAVIPKSVPNGDYCFANILANHIRDLSSLKAPETSREDTKFLHHQIVTLSSVQFNKLIPSSNKSCDTFSHTSYQTDSTDYDGPVIKGPPLFYRYGPPNKTLPSPKYSSDYFDRSGSYSNSRHSQRTLMASPSINIHD